MVEERWRLIENGAESGEQNMAVDQTLLELAEPGVASPVLRFYRWERPTLSVGHLQKIGGLIDTDYLGKNNIPLVRRPTGGRAILHDDEVTYSVIIPKGSQLYRPLRPLFRVISSVLRVALAGCGVAVDTDGGADTSRPMSTPCCFAARSHFEISSGGKKVSGSAQRRIKSSALQQGSIILSMNVTSYLSCFIWQDEGQRKMAEQMMGGINIGRTDEVNQERLRHSIISAFEMLYGIILVPDRLSDAEEEQVANIIKGVK